MATVFLPWERGSVLDDRALSDALLQVLHGEPRIPQAYLGMAHLVDECVAHPSLIIQVTEPVPQSLAVKLAEAAMPYLKTGSFQVIPVRDGIWWKEIERQGLVVKAATRH